MSESTDPTPPEEEVHVDTPEQAAARAIIEQNPRVSHVATDVEATPDAVEPVDASLAVLNPTEAPKP